jgi:hypothetical protein
MRYFKAETSQGERRRDPKRKSLSFCTTRCRESFLAIREIEFTGWGNTFFRRRCLSNVMEWMTLITIRFNSGASSVEIQKRIPVSREGAVWGSRGVVFPTIE